jgi:hypothetical protein
MCQLIVYYSRYFAHYLSLLIVILFGCSILIHSCLTFVSFDSFAFIVLLFKGKRLNSYPGLHSRYFDPVVQEPAVKNTITIYASQ